MAVLDRAEFAAADDIAEIQQSNWLEQRTRLGSSEFYKRFLGQEAFPESIEEITTLPFSDKSMLRADQADHPPFGSYLAADPDRISRVHRTSGMTGQAMNIVLSENDARVTAIVGARAQSAAGLGPGHRVVHCLNYQMWMGGLTDHMVLEATGAAVIPFGVGNSRLLVETIQELGVTAISCTPSYPAALEAVIAKEFPGLAPRDLGLKLALFGGEAGLDSLDFRARLEDVWGFKPRNANYGVSDVFCNFASQCDHNNDLHFMGADVLLTELIDPESDALIGIEDGNTGELVLTHLDRECQPLARFKTGDILDITGTGRCACGRTGFRFRVVGRSDDMVVIRGINVFPTMVATVLEGLDGVNGEYRIVLDGDGPFDRLPVEVEIDRGGPVNEAVRVRVDVALKKALRVTPDITLVATDTLPRTDGKTRRVIRR
jgi:phenylacetate-CoA ligase